MKVQLRDEQYRIGPWKVVEEAPSYYIAKDPDHGGITLLRKADYEPVREWVRTYYVVTTIDKVRMKSEGHITIIEVKK